MSKSMVQLSTDVTGGWVEISAAINRLSQQALSPAGLHTWHHQLGELIPKVRAWSDDMQELHDQVGRAMDQGGPR